MIETSYKWGALTIMLFGCHVAQTNGTLNSRMTQDQAEGVFLRQDHLRGLEG